MPSEPESLFYPRVFALATAAVLGIAVWRILQPFIGAILWSILVAFLLYPVNRRLRDALGGHRAGVAVLLTLGFIVLLLGPALAVSVSGRAQISALPVFLGLAGGLSAFGPIGIVLGPVIVELVLTLVRFAEESRPPAAITAGDAASHAPSVRVAGGDG